MNISYFTAVSAMNAFQKDLDVTANNMANVSTNGYKSMRSSFDDLPHNPLRGNPARCNESVSSGCRGKHACDHTV